MQFKTMTSPQTRNGRNNSLLAKMNDISDSFKNASPTDMYRGYRQTSAKYLKKNGMEEVEPESDCKVKSLFGAQQNHNGDGSNCSRTVSRFITC